VPVQIEYQCLSVACGVGLGGECDGEIAACDEKEPGSPVGVVR